MADDSQLAAAAAGVKIADKPVLWSYWRSSCSWRVRIALNLKGIDYEYKAVHLVKDGGQQHNETFIKKSPMHEVPCLEIDGHALVQSIAIVQYLEDTRPEPSLMPKSAVDRARVRAIVDSIAMDIQPVQNLRVLTMIGQKINEGAKAEWAKHWIERGLIGVEAMVKESAGTYCVGDTVTVADLTLVPQLFNARRFAVPMEQFPTLLRVEAALKQLPAFQKAEPSVQPDAE